MLEKINDWTGGEAFMGYCWKKSEDESQELQTGPYAQKISQTFQEVVLTLAKIGHHIVIDDVSLGREQLDEWKKALKDYQVLWFGINAPLPLLEQRKKERGDRIRVRVVVLGKIASKDDKILIQFQTLIYSFLYCYPFIII
jgi:chloramphenicol 3-O phosphotransferase